MDTLYRTLGEVATYVNGRAFKPTEWESNGLPIIRIQNLTDENAKFNYSSTAHEDKYLIHHGDLLFAWSASLGAHIWHGKEAWLNQHIFHVIPKADMDKMFLYYFLCHVVAELYAKTHGSGMVHITKAPFMATRIPVPTLEEQKRIVARIEELFSELDNGVETLQKTKQQLAVYRQAVYSSVFTDDMPMHVITEYFDVSGGLTKNSKRNEMSIKMPYLRVANVYYNQLDLSEIKYIGVHETEIDRCSLEKDDVMFVEGNGSKSQIGRVAIWDGSIEKCLHQNHLIKGRPNGKMLSKYALYYLISSGGRKQITEVAKSTSGLYTLSTNKVRELRIPYCSLEQQQAMVDRIEMRLDECTRIEKTVDTALQQAEAMRQSILKQAFEGRL